jgi:hypothetical protein
MTANSPDALGGRLPLPDHSAAPTAPNTTPEANR